MSGFIANSETYNICTENEISSILARFNSEYIFDIIKDNLEMKYKLSLYTFHMPNIISSFELNFSQLKMIYTNPDDLYRIEEVRIETYKEVLQIIGGHFGLIINHDEIKDYYSAAYSIYDLFVANFTSNIIKFFTNYIIKEKNVIYDVLNLNDFKKNKDTTTLYNKKLYKNIKLAIINTNLEYVITSLSGYDVSFNTLLNIIYDYDKNMVNYIETIVSPTMDLYRNSFIPLTLNSGNNVMILTNIRIEIQKCSLSEDINVSNINNL